MRRAGPLRRQCAAAAPAGSTVRHAGRTQPMARRGEDHDCWRAEGGIFRFGRNSRIIRSVGRYRIIRIIRYNERVRMIPARSLVHRRSPRWTPKSGHHADGLRLVGMVTFRVRVVIASATYSCRMPGRSHGSAALLDRTRPIVSGRRFRANEIFCLRNTFDRFSFSLSHK